MSAGWDDEEDGYVINSATDISINYAGEKGACSGINMPHWILSGGFTEGLQQQAVNNPIMVNCREDYTVEYLGEIVYSDVFTYSESYNYEAFNGDYPSKFTITYTEDSDDNPLKKSKMAHFLKGLHKKAKHTRQTSDTYISHYEIKYIQAK